MLHIFDTLWLHPALAVVLVGVVVLWRGLAGERSGERGLVRRTTTALGRAEGWRHTLIGLTVIGLGLAWFWELRWLLFLTLGIGFVEIQEASMVIRAWKAGERRSGSKARRTALPESSRTPS